MVWVGLGDIWLPVEVLSAGLPRLGQSLEDYWYRGRVLENALLCGGKCRDAGFIQEIQAKVDTAIKLA